MSHYDSILDSDAAQSDSLIPLYPPLRCDRVIEYDAAPYKFELFIGGEHDGILLRNAVEILWHPGEIEPLEFQHAYRDALDAHTCYTTFYRAVDNPDPSKLPISTVDYHVDELKSLIEYDAERFDEHELTYMRRYIHAMQITLILARGDSWRNVARFIPTATGEIDGYVYLIRSPTGAYKIGRSKNPKDRIQTFEVKLPFEIQYIVTIRASNMSGLERALHEKYGAKRINGEWFALDEQDVDDFRWLCYLLGGVK